MISGLTTKITSAGIPVVRCHYSTDPKKRAGTPEGDIWLAQELLGYPGGIKSPRWRKEMEIEYGALGGTRLFPEWEQWANNGKIVIAPFEPFGYHLYGSYDHGWRNPACYLVHGINSDGLIATFYEFYGDHVPLQKISELIHGKDITLADGRRFRGNPFAEKEIFKIADPSIWAEDQPMVDNTNKSIAELFRRSGVYFSKGERGGDAMVAEWLYGHYWKDPLNPLYRITTACPKLIWELGQQRHKEYSPQVALHRNQPEELIDKDNHAWDSAKMFFQKFPPKPQASKALHKPNTFQWWRKMAAKEGFGTRTFRI